MACFLVPIKHVCIRLINIDEHILIKFVKERKNTMKALLRNSKLKGILLVLLFASIQIVSYGQGVGIGTTNPDNSAILDLSSSDKGLLLPRMSLKQRTSIKNPANGLIVYQTDMMSGIYVYNGSDWSAMGNTEAKLTTADNSIWSTSGNSGLDGTQHFIGTVDEVPLIFKVNNFFSGKIDAQRGTLMLGYRSGIISNAYNSVILGSLAMQKANNSGNNVAIGFQAMYSNEAGGHNLALGTGALAANASGNNNVAIGSLSGYKSTGSGNVFLGFQSGYAESGSNKLIVVNDANRRPLIYGDFETGKLGINTVDLTSALNINSNADNKSGLRFLNLTSASPTQATNGKVLSVANNGEVILVPDVQGTNSNWLVNGNHIENKNSGSVMIKNNLRLGAFNSSSATQAANGKVLSVNGDGDVILVPDVAGNNVVSRWNANGDNIENNNAGKVMVKNGLQLSNLQNMSSKILGLDDAGNVIPVDKPTGGTGATTTTDGLWYINNLGALNPADNKDVHLNTLNTYRMNVGWGGIKFIDLNSNYENPYPSNGLALSLDEFGDIILTRNSDGGTGGGGSSVWGFNNNILSTPGDNKVVIGTGLSSLPEGYSLYVKKGILAERLRVATSGSAKWADYVFADDYKLMPLKEVEEFIEENDHLPNVPSAEQVAEEGIDMAEMAAKHMEKIEELTLYLIEANKRIEQLEQTVAELHKDK